MADDHEVAIVSGNDLLGDVTHAYPRRAHCRGPEIARPVRKV